MLKSNAPTQLTVAFASGAGAGPINAIPIPASGTAGAASWTTGFTAVNMEPIGSGGIPPFGADFNGIFNALSNAQIWEQAGYLYPYSSAFSTAVGGYPAGASLAMASGLGLWINQSDSNTTNPDTTASANWVEMCANGGAASIALSGALVTPTANQLGVRLLILTGALSAACKLVLPLRNGASWKILNNTTGAQTVTVGGTTGSTVTIAAGSAGAQEVFTDGANYYTTSFNGSGVYLPISGNAVSASKWANARTLAMSGDVVWSISVDGSANATAAGTIQAGVVTLAKMANFTANSLMGNPAGSAAAPSAVTLGAGLQFSSSQLQLVPTGAQVIGWLGYTPVNKAGDTMSGTLNITTSGTNSLNITSSSTNSASMQLINTASGGRTYAMGSFNATSSGVTGYGVYDGTASKFAMYIDATNQLTNNGKIRAVTSSGPAYDANVADNNWAMIINDVNDLNTRGGIWRSSSTPGVALINVLAGFKGIWAYDNGTFATDGAMTVNGAFTCTGTANLNTSDRTLKDSIEVIAARPLHRSVEFTSYRRWDLDLWGKGLLAQDLIAEEPLYGGAYEHTFEDGEKAIKLGINEAKAALEESWWCGDQIDRIIVALKARGIEVQ